MASRNDQLHGYRTNIDSPKRQKAMLTVYSDDEDDDGPDFYEGATGMPRQDDPSSAASAQLSRQFRCTECGRMFDGGRSHVQWSVELLLELNSFLSCFRSVSCRTAGASAGSALPAQRLVANLQEGWDSPRAAEVRRGLEPLRPTKKPDNGPLPLSTWAPPRATVPMKPLALPVPHTSGPSNANGLSSSSRMARAPSLQLHRQEPFEIVDLTGNSTSSRQMTPCYRPKTPAKENTAPSIVSIQTENDGPTRLDDAAKFRSLMKQVEDQKVRNRHLENERDQLKRDHKRTVDRLEDEAVKLRKDRDRDRQTGTERASQLQAQIANLREQLRKAANPPVDPARLPVNIQLEAQVKALKREQEDLMREKERIETTSMGRTIELSTKISALESKLSREKGKRKHPEQENTRLKTRCATAEEEKAELATKLTQLRRDSEAQVADLEQQLADSQAQNERLTEAARSAPNRTSADDPPLVKLLHYDFSNGLPPRMQGLTLSGEPQAKLAEDRQRPQRKETHRKPRSVDPSRPHTHPLRWRPANICTNTTDSDQASEGETATSSTDGVMRDSARKRTDTRSRQRPSSVPNTSDSAENEFPITEAISSEERVPERGRANDEEMPFANGPRFSEAEQEAVRNSQLQPLLEKRLGLPKILVPMAKHEHDLLAFSERKKVRAPDSYHDSTCLR